MVTQKLPRALNPVARKSSSCLIFVFWLGLPASTAAIEPVGDHPSDETIIERTADAIYPTKMLAGLTLQACDTAYKTSLSTKLALVEAENVLPGLRDRMAAVALAHCSQALPAATEKRSAIVRSLIHRHLTAADLQRLFPIFNRLAEQQSAAITSITIRPGERVSDAEKRIEWPDFEKNDQFAARFFSRPTNQNLKEKLGELQRDLVAQMPIWRSEDILVMKAALGAARRVANAYAREKGYEPLYPDA